MPSEARRWAKEGKEWLDSKRARRKYEGKHGNDALRFLVRVGPSLGVAPKEVTEDDLWRVIPSLPGGSNTHRWESRILGAFLSQHADNWVVQRSGIGREFPNRPERTPVATAEEWERVMDCAQGPERLVVAFLWMRRTVELSRARVSDIHLADGTYDIRQKGGHDEITDRGLPMSETLIRELTWWLPLRARWAAEAIVDEGFLLCRWDDRWLVRVSKQYIRRRAAAAGARAGVRLPNHSYRRGAATLLRDRGAEWEDVQALGGWKDLGTTQRYVKSLQQKRRVPTVARLLDPRPVEAS